MPADLAPEYRGGFSIARLRASLLVAGCMHFTLSGGPFQRALGVYMPLKGAKGLASHLTKDWLLP